MMKTHYIPIVIATCCLLAIPAALRANAAGADSAVASAQEALAQNHPDQAISALTAYTKAPVSDPVAYRILAEAYLASGMPDKAIKPAETAVKLAIEPQEKAKCDLVDGNAYLGKAEEMKNNGDSDTSSGTAPISSTSSRALSDTGGDGGVIMADPKYNNGANVDRIGSFPSGDDPSALLSKAEKSYGEANKLSPDIGKVHNQLALAYLMDSRIDDAKNEFNKQLKLAGPLPESDYWLGQLDMAAGDSAGAIRSYQGALAINPEDPNLYAALAKLYQKDKKSDEAAWALGMADVYSGDSAGAESAFEKAGDAAPGVLRGRAALAIASQHSDMAKDLLAKAITADPNDAQALVMQGDLLLQSGDADEAVKSYKAAAMANPQAEASFVGLAKAYDSKGDLDGAIAAYQSALKVDPNNQEALLNSAVDSANSKHYADAITDLQNYLKRYPVAANESAVESELDQIKAQSAK